MLVNDNEVKPKKPKCFAEKLKLKCKKIAEPKPPKPLDPKPADEVPPPPPPHEAEPEKKKVKVSIEGNYQRLAFPPYGHLVVSLGDGSLSAHCGYHGSRCRLPKTLKKMPIGYLLAFLKRGAAMRTGPEFSDDHKLMKYEF